MPQLIVIAPTGHTTVYSFEQERIVVGRSPESTLFVRDIAVSRFHVEIRREGDDHWLVTDLGSRNGTRLNGKDLVGTLPLEPDDAIGLGDTTVVFGGAPAAASGVSERSTATDAWSGVGSGSGREGLSLVGRSQAIAQLKRTIAKYACSDATVLITGENGTGKELVARLLHQGSQRRDRPFCVINCPALPESLLEAELFGVERGVATGVEPRPGRFEAAQGGTVLLDEIGDMPAPAQAKILRVIEEKTLDRVGGRKPLPIDVRILAATHHELKSDIAGGSFRRDLYHRLNTLSLTVPPLRERPDDIPLLIEHFIGLGPRPRLSMSPEALGRLMSYSFPGNVRELERLVERCTLLAEADLIGLEDLPEDIVGEAAPLNGSEPDEAALLYERITRGGESFWEVVREPFLRRALSRQTARAVVERARREAGGSYKEAARILGVESEYRRFHNFIYHHDLRLEDS